MARVSVLGAGAWGTALALTLLRGGHEVTLATRRKTHLVSLRASGENKPYLPSIQLPSALRLEEIGPSAVRDTEFVVMAIPSPFARAALSSLALAIPSDSIMISVAKGIEQISLQTMSQMMAETAVAAERVAVLSGPGFAAETARGKPAALVAAAHNEAVANRVQALFAIKPLRTYRSRDVTGVELGGASKNVIAIAAGISDGLGLGAGARAALITRGLAEMMRLAERSGAERITLAGLAGLGDLVLTCTGDLSRNRALGLRLARGERPTIPAQDQPVAEGVFNARSIHRLAAKLDVEMPIVAAVQRVLYEGVAASAMVDELLSRELKAEF
jgi:glycerol-3-phosphate dehydrogenase (NAD(P)+)